MREPRDLCGPSEIPLVERFRSRVLADFPNEKPCWTPFFEAVYRELSEQVGEQGAYVSMGAILEDVMERDYIGDRTCSDPYNRYLNSALQNHAISSRVSRTGEDYETATETMKRYVREAVHSWVKDRPVEECPDCHRPKWTPEAEIAGNPHGLWCECPILKVEPYTYGEDEL